MANTFKNASTPVLTTSTIIYTCPVGKSAVVFGLYFPNVNGVVVTNVTIQVYDASSAITTTIGKELPIPIGATLEYGKIALEAGDVLRATAPVNNQVSAFANILEIS